MAKKRANGEGSIRKRSDGRWEGRYTAGYQHRHKLGWFRDLNAPAIPQSTEGGHLFCISLEHGYGETYAGSLSLEP